MDWTQSRRCVCTPFTKAFPFTHFQLKETGSSILGSSAQLQRSVSLCHICYFPWWKAYELSYHNYKTESGILLSRINMYSITSQMRYTIRLVLSVWSFMSSTVSTIQKPQECLHLKSRFYHSSQYEGSLPVKKVLMRNERILVNMLDFAQGARLACNLALDHLYFRYQLDL